MSTYSRTGILEQGILSALLIPLLAGGPASAQESAEREQLMALLEEQTELATKTRLNADYVPGIINILHGNELERRGVRTVWDALGFVPGINPVIDQTGQRDVIVRGLGAVGDTWSSGNVKVLLNGVPFNSANFGLAETIYHLPIEQVDRIEVIRGPGSAVHGEHAVAGVINVITRREGNRVFTFAGSEAYRGGGMVLTSESDTGLRMTFNASTWSSDGADAEVDADALHQFGLSEASFAPGQANEGIRATNAVVDLAFGGFSLLGQWSESETGDYFGVNYILPPEDRIVEQNWTRSLEARYRHSLNSGWVEASAGRTTNRVVKDDLYAFPSELPPIEIPDGEPLLVDQDYEERKRYAGVDWSVKAGSHQLLLAWYGARIEVHQSKLTDNYGLSSSAVEEGVARELDSLALQDEYRMSDAFTVTAGVRYDHYEDVGTSIAPRLAAVWRFDERRVLKAQYGQAFRPPTLTEQAIGEPGIEPTVIDTVEVGYLAKGPLGEFRLTGAYSEVEDIIVFDPTHAPDFFFANQSSARLGSVEVEGKYRLGDTELTGALAYTDTSVSGPADQIPGSSDWLGRVGVQRQLPYRTTANLQYRYVSNFHRQPEDPRPEADGYDTVDLTLTTRPVNGTRVRLGISNLLDADVRQPAFLATSPSGEPVVSYPDDLPRAGRTYWLQLAYDF